MLNEEGMNAQIFVRIFQLAFIVIICFTYQLLNCVEIRKIELNYPFLN